MRKFWEFWREMDTPAERKGAEAAKRGNASPEQAAFLVNLDKPTENPQHKDLRAVEDFLHGYYGVMVDRLRAEFDECYRERAYWSRRAAHAEEVLNAYKSSKTGSNRDKRTAKTNRRSARSNPRGNRTTRASSK